MQAAIYNRTAPFKLERSTINGKALYLYADKKKGVVYIGEDEAYQRYSQLLRQSMAEKENEDPAIQPGSIISGYPIPPGYTLSRYDGDYNYLANPANRTDTDVIKYIRLFNRGSSYFVTQGGDLRGDAKAAARKSAVAVTSRAENESWISNASTKPGRMELRLLLVREERSRPKGTENSSLNPSVCRR